MKRIDFMIDEEDNDALDYISAKEGMSKAWLIRQSIKTYLSSIKKEKK